MADNNNNNNPQQTAKIIREVAEATEQATKATRSHTEAVKQNSSAVKDQVAAINSVSDSQEKIGESLENNIGLFSQFFDFIKKQKDLFSKLHKEEEKSISLVREGIEAFEERRKLEQSNAEQIAENSKLLGEFSNLQNTTIKNAKEGLRVQEDIGILEANRIESYEEIRELNSQIIDQVEANKKLYESMNESERSRYDELVEAVENEFKKNDILKERISINEKIREHEKVNEAEKLANEDLYRIFREERLGGIEDQIDANKELSEKEKKAFKESHKEFMDSISQRIKFFKDSVNDSLKTLNMFWNGIKRIGTGLIGVVTSFATMPSRIFRSLLEYGNQVRKQYLEIGQNIENMREKFGDLSQAGGRSVAQMDRAISNLGGSVGRTNIGLSDLFGIHVHQRRLKIIEESIKVLGDLGASFDLVRDSVVENAGELLVLRRGLDITGESFDAFARRSLYSGETLTDQLLEVAKASQVVGDEFGLTSKMISRDVGTLRGDFGNFGLFTSRELVNMATYTRRLGIEVKELSGLVSTFDSFEGAANASAALSQAFGMQVDAMDMLLEQDPARRMDMLRESFYRTGRSVEDLTRQELKYISSQMGVSEEAARQILALENIHKSYEEIENSSEGAMNQMSDTEALNMVARDVNLIIDGFTQFKSLLEAFVHGFMEVFGYGGQLGSLGNIVSEFTERVRNLGMAVGTIVRDSGLGRWVGEIERLFTSGQWQTHFDNFKKLFADFFGSFEDGPLSGRIANAISGLLTGFSNLAKEIFFGENSEFGSMLGTMMGRLTATFTRGVLEAVTWGLRFLVNGTVDSALQVFNSPLLNNFLDEWKTVFEGFFDYLEATWKALSPQLFQFLRDTGNLLVDVFTESVLPRIFSWIKDDAIPLLWDTITGNPEVFQSAGTAMGGAFMVGFAKNLTTTLASSAYDSAIEGIADRLTRGGTATGIQAAGEAVGSRSLNAAAEQAGAASRAATPLGEIGNTNPASIWRSVPTIVAIGAASVALAYAAKLIYDSIQESGGNVGEYAIVAASIGGLAISLGGVAAILTGVSSLPGADPKTILSAMAMFAVVGAVTAGIAYLVIPQLEKIENHEGLIEKSTALGLLTTSIGITSGIMLITGAAAAALAASTAGLGLAAAFVAAGAVFIGVAGVVRYGVVGLLNVVSNVRINENQIAVLDILPRLINSLSGAALSLSTSGLIGALSAFNPSGASSTINSIGLFVDQIKETVISLIDVVKREFGGLSEQEISSISFGLNFIIDFMEVVSPLTDSIVSLSTRSLFQIIPGQFGRDVATAANSLTGFIDSVTTSILGVFNTVTTLAQKIDLPELERSQALATQVLVPMVSATMDIVGLLPSILSEINGGSGVIDQALRFAVGTSPALAVLHAILENKEKLRENFESIGKFVEVVSTSVSTSLTSIMTAVSGITITDEQIRNFESILPIVQMSFELMRFAMHFSTVVMQHDIFEYRRDPTPPRSRSAYVSTPVNKLDKIKEFIEGLFKGEGIGGTINSIIDIVKSGSERLPDTTSMRMVFGIVSTTVDLLRSTMELSSNIFITVERLSRDGDEDSTEIRLQAASSHLSSQLENIQSFVKDSIEFIINSAIRVDELPSVEDITRILDSYKLAVNGSLEIARSVYDFGYSIVAEEENNEIDPLRVHHAINSTVQSSSAVVDFSKQIFELMDYDLDISKYRQFLETISVVTATATGLQEAISSIAALSDRSTDLRGIASRIVDAASLRSAVSKLEGYDTEISNINLQAEKIGSATNSYSMEMAINSINQSSELFNAIATASNNITALTATSANVMTGFTDRFVDIIDSVNDSADKLIEGSYVEFMSTVDLSLTENANFVLAEFAAIDRILENGLPTISLSGTLSRFSEAVRLARENIRVETRPININIDLNVQLDRGALIENLADNSEGVWVNVTMAEGPLQ